MGGEMTEQQQAELAFWRNEVERLGPGEFMRARASCAADYIGAFGGQLDLYGYGLEVGAGALSMMHFIPQLGHTISIDPLLNEYRKMAPWWNYGRDASVEHHAINGADMPNDWAQGFDWVVCWNTIDHTPNPDKMIAEILRVLRPCGALYLEVHFDDVLGPAHYGLWTIETVREKFGAFDRTWEYQYRCDPCHQSHYYAIMRKPE